MIIVNNVFIGTSGYDYPEWKGFFYPEKLARKEFLNFYSTQFNALELNSTFYNMPTAERLFSFYERTNGNVHFSVKANNLLTHKINKEWKKDADDFKNAILVLAQKKCLQTILFQFPEKFGYTRENRIYLASLLEIFVNIPIVIEFRNKTWIRKSVFDELKALNIGIVFCSFPQFSENSEILKQLPITSNNIYFRLHGSFSNRITEDLSVRKTIYAILKETRGQDKTIQIYFPNQANGESILQALKLKDFINGINN